MLSGPIARSVFLIMASFRVKKTMKALEGEISKAIVGLVLEVQSELAEDTPVKTGWARANWVITKGAPSLSPVGSPQAPGPGNVGAAAILTYKVDGPPAFIANNVPYITSLNAGSSAKAPPAFVEFAIAKAIVSRGLAKNTGQVLDQILPNSPEAFR